MLQHIPDDVKALEYLFVHYLENAEPDVAQTYFDRLQALQPMAKTVAVNKRKLLIARVRQAFGRRDFAQAEQYLREVFDMPAVDSNLYRYAIVPIALSYVCDELQGQDGDFPRCVELAGKTGMEKPLPLVFSILAEGREHGLSEKTLRRLEADWAKGISGRCNGNTAGMLGDLVLAAVAADCRHPATSMNIMEAASFVNRAGQVAWHSEKDLFTTCHFLWFQAFLKGDPAYRRTLNTLVRKGVKQYPDSLFFRFFAAELYYADIAGWASPVDRQDAVRQYHEVLRQCDLRRQDPDCFFVRNLSARRIRELENSAYGFDDDDFDDEDDD